MVAPAAADQLNVGVLLTFVSPLVGEESVGALNSVVKLLVEDQADAPTTLEAFTLQ